MSDQDVDIFSFLKEYVRFPSVSCDEKHRADMAATRRFLCDYLQKIGLQVQEIPAEKHDIVFAKNDHVAGRRTVLLYGHYDVQPAEEPNWETDPFLLTERNGRLYARGASDDKGGNAAFLVALGKLLSENSKFPLNVNVVLEGEEEIGSPGMLKFLQKYREELRADFAVVADTGSIDEKNIIITTGLRGLVGFELTLRSSESDIHSGYGGAIINPIRELSSLIAGLHNFDGSVNIPGFYDSVVAPSRFEREQVRSLPFTDHEFLETLGAKKLSTDKDEYSAINSMRFLPTLELNGITGGYQGDGLKTIIPNEASAKITCRLVNNQDASTVKDLIESAIRERIDPNLSVDLNFEKASNPYNLLANPDCFDDKTALGYGLKLADQGIKDVFGHRPRYLREGGSIALMRLLKDVLNLDSILIGLSSAHDHIHDANESISIEMLSKGCLFFQNFLANLASD